MGECLDEADEKEYNGIKNRLGADGDESDETRLYCEGVAFLLYGDIGAVFRELGEFRADVQYSAAFTENIECVWAFAVDGIFGDVDDDGLYGDRAAPYCRSGRDARA